MTGFRHRFLFGRSMRSDAPEKMLTGRYHLALVAPSWDHRCEVITQATQLTIDTTVLLRFTAKDEYGFQVNHEAKIESFLKRCSKHISVINGDALKLNEMWSELWRTATQIADKYDEPLRVLVDLSTCPRYYSLGLISGMLRQGLARTVTVFYAEGRYTEKHSIHPIDFSFTLGEWKTIAIPFVAGMPDALKKKAYVVSVGFEGVKTMRVLSKEDPDRVALLFPDPGVDPSYVSEAWTRNKEIIEQFRIKDKQIIRAAAGDAIGAWRALTEAAVEHQEQESVYYLCSGTKPHALALSLRAMCVGFPTVLYNLPERHSFVEVEPSGVFWVYRIEDLAAPTGALGSS